MPAKPGWAKTVVGGVTSAIAPIALTLTPGLIAFQPLGPHYLGYAATAGLLATIVGNLITSVLGDRPASISGPRATSCLVIAAFLTTLLRSDPGLSATVLVGMVALCVVASGLLQIGFAIARIGTVVRYVPYPVIAGYSAGVGLLIALTQLPALLGVQNLESVATGGTSSLRWLALALGLSCAALIGLIKQVRPSWPASLLVLVAGVLADLLLERFVGRAALGPTIGNLSVMVDWETLHTRIEEGFVAALTGKHLATIAMFAMALAIIASLDSLLSALTVENATLARSSPNRELLAQGLGNAASGLFGGTPIALSHVRVLSAWRLGGDSRLTGVFHSAAMLLVALAGAGFVARLPMSVLAGVMLSIAWDLADPWLRTSVREVLREPAGLRETAWDLGVATLVMLTTAFVDFLVAIGVGMVCSLILFVRAANRSVVRYVGPATPSRSLRPIDQMLFLHAQRDRVAVFGLQGPLFFGTTESVAGRVRKLGRQVQFVLLDLQRVTSIDVTAIFVLNRMAAELKRNKRTLLIANSDEKRLPELAHAITLSKIWEAAQHFGDRDEALEWVEQQVLSGRFPDDDRRDLALAEVALRTYRCVLPIWVSNPVALPLPRKRSPPEQCLSPSRRILTCRRGNSFQPS